MAGQDSPFAVAFQQVLAYPLDRRILLALVEAKTELRYEELRRTVSPPSGRTPPQMFKDAVDRLMAMACVDRRLEPQGERYLSYLRPTKQGKTIALVLKKFEEVRLPQEVPQTVKKDVERVIRGQEMEATA